jgi:hypothetical protein
LLRAVFAPPDFHAFMDVEELISGKMKLDPATPNLLSDKVS